MLSPRSVVILTLLALAFAPLRADAQSGNKGGPPGYAEAINQALTELDANNYPEAREEFKRAHAIYPNARTLRGLGMVDFELRNYTQSVAQLEEALASTVKPLEGKLRIETETLLERARRYVGTVVVKLDPPGAALSVDGISTDVRDGGLRLEVGEHTFEAQAPGRATERRVVRVAGNERIALKLSLPTLQAEAADTSAANVAPSNGAESSSTPPSEVQPAYKKWWVWTMVAVVAVGGATAAALVLTRDKRTKAVEGTNTPDVTLQTLERF